MGEERTGQPEAGKPHGTAGTPDQTPTGGSAAASTGTSVGAYMGLGLQFAISILVFAFLGQWADRRFGTDPWLLLIGVFLGGGGSFYSIYRRLMTDLEREERQRRDAGGRR